MKKIAITIFLLSLIVNFSTVAQNLIAVQHGSSSTFYTTLGVAIVNAQNGDTIYIPGGDFICGTLTINKQLHLIGVGIDPDSALATKPTQINGGFYLTTGSVGSTFSGLRINNIQLSNSSGSIVISRCWIDGLMLGDSLSSTSSDNVFFENILGNVQGQDTQNNLFFNNMILDYVSHLGSNTLFRNNLFFIRGTGFCKPGAIWSTYAYINYIHDSFFENNIFLSFLSSCEVSNCNFRNNLTTYALNPESIGPGCYSFNNIEYQQLSAIFISYTNNYFRFSDDYRLQLTSPGKNAGTDGTDIGVYGGFHPWKDGSMPANPYIKLKNISNSTDLNGNLNVNIKVSAQDH
jgi:hypothetical protein